MENIDMCGGKHEHCDHSYMAVVAWMRRQVDEGGFRERLTGEPQFTELAEAAAFEFDHDEWLDDETSPLWDAPSDAYPE